MSSKELNCNLLYHIVGLANCLSLADRVNALSDISVGIVVSCGGKDLDREVLNALTRTSRELKWIAKILTEMENDRPPKQ